MIPKADGLRCIPPTHPNAFYSQVKDTYKQSLFLYAFIISMARPLLNLQVSKMSPSDIPTLLLAKVYIPLCCPGPHWAAFQGRLFLWLFHVSCFSDLNHSPLLLSWWISMPPSSLVLFPSILNLLPLCALPTPWLSTSLFTNQNQLRQGSSCIISGHYNKHENKTASITICIWFVWEQFPQNQKDKCVKELGA